MNRCSNGACRGMVNGVYKQCLSCRISKAAHMRRVRILDKVGIENRKSAVFKKERWTQERWTEFVNSGGLKGL